MRSLVRYMVMSSGSKILLIEDNAGVRETVGEILRQAGYSVSVCADALAGSRAIEEDVFHLVLCDYALPGMDGLEFSAIVRKASPEIPFILMSSVAPSDIAVESVLAGAASFLSKPFDAGDLLWLVERSLRLGPNYPSAAVPSGKTAPLFPELGIPA